MSAELLDALKWETRLSDMDRTPLRMLEHWAPLLAGSIEGATAHYSAAKSFDAGWTLEQWLAAKSEILVDTNDDRITYENSTQWVAFFFARAVKMYGREVATEHAQRLMGRYV